MSFDILTDFPDYDATDPVAIVNWLKKHLTKVTETTTFLSTGMCKAFRDLDALWPGHYPTALALVLKVKGLMRVHAVEESPLYLVPVKLDDLRADQTYLGVCRGFSFGVYVVLQGAKLITAHQYKELYLIATNEVFGRSHEIASR